MPIIRSMIDSDCYKFSMQQAVLECYQGVPVVYEFTDRAPTGLMNYDFLRTLRTEIDAMADLRLASVEAVHLGQLGFLSPQYIDYLRNFRFDPGQVSIWLDEQLHIAIKGTWESTILWEVPSLALISEIYFNQFPGSQAVVLDEQNSMEKNALRLHEKGSILSGLRFTDFGTRRRRNYEYQDQAVSILKGYQGFQGSSNVHLARLHGVKSVGTVAHEWFMGVSVMEGLRHANRHALRAWNKVYKGRLGIALTDTFGGEAFWEDFDPELSRLFDGVRHDSGDPVAFTERAIRHYKSVGVYPPKKDVVYSDGLTATKCRELANQFEGQIGQSFGIGTHLSNDVPGSPALKIVIKLRKCNGVEVVKLSDDPGKATGNRDALRVARYTFFDTPLDDDKQQGNSETASL